MKNFFLIIAILLPYFIKAQIITIFAGNGINSYSGSGIPAISAGIPNPNGGIFDKFGNYYFADLGARRVRKVDTSGIITTVAGNGLGGPTVDGGQATASRITDPDDVKLDSLGNLYISDASNNNIRRVDITTGIISTIVGTGTGGFSGDNGPATAAKISDPQAICFDRKGNLYVSDLFNYRVRKINTLGIITTFAGTGSPGSTGDNGPATNATLDIPAGLVADDTGNIFIADYGGFSNCVRKVDTFGIITTFAGNGSAIYTGDGVPATNAQISPIWLAIDSLGLLYIADRTNYRVYKIDGAGIIHSIAGNGSIGFGGMGGPATAAPLDFPDGVALDACNNLYIPLGDSNRILKVTYNPTCDPYHALPLGITEISSSIISIYPNPAFTTLIINSPNKISHITISNLLGQSEYSHAYDAEKVEIKIGNLPPGMYLLELIGEDGERVVRKVVKD